MSDLIHWWREWWAGVLDALPHLLNGAAVFAIGFGVAWLLRTLVRALGKRWKMRAVSRMLLSRFAYVVVLLFAALLALQVAFPEADLAGLAGALGIGSLILGFALQDIVANFVSGFFILATKPFDIGDQIVSGEDEGYVEAIQFRATLLRTYDHRLIVIPNKELYTTRVEVNTAFAKRRFNLEVTFPNSTPIEPVQQAMLQLLRTTDGILQDPEPEVLALESYDYANSVTLRFWLTPSYRTVYRHMLSRLNILVNDVLEEMGIGNIRPESMMAIESTGAVLSRANSNAPGNAGLDAAVVTSGTATKRAANSTATKRAANSTATKRAAKSTATKRAPATKKATPGATTARKTGSTKSGSTKPIAGPSARTTKRSPRK